MDLHIEQRLFHRESSFLFDLGGWFTFPSSGHMDLSRVSSVSVATLSTMPDSDPEWFVGSSWFPRLHR